MNSQRFRDALIKIFNEQDEVLQTGNIDDAWKFLFDNILRDTDQVCVCCKHSTRPKVSLWWDSVVDRAIGAKEQAWKNGGSRELY